MSSQSSALAVEWYLLHLPAIIASDSQRIVSASIPSVLLRAALGTGYIDTVILLAAILWVARLALHTLRKLSSPLKHAH